VTSRPRTPAQDAGDAAEGLVAARLESLGWTILARNLHVGRQELDIVAIDHGRPRALVAVEVRWRARRQFGLPEETFDWRKRRRMREAAFGLLDRGRLPDGQPLPLLPLRFDLVLVEPATALGGEPRIRHHRNVLGG
jgi:Holliday junction resolvase-like predicted endonuclease